MLFLSHTDLCFYELNKLSRCLSVTFQMNEVESNGGGKASEYHLSWNNYEASLASFLRILSSAKEGEEALSDVTISCSGGKLFQVPKPYLVCYLRSLCCRGYLIIQKYWTQLCFGSRERTNNFLFFYTPVPSIHKSTFDHKLLFSTNSIYFWTSVSKVVLNPALAS